MPETSPLRGTEMAEGEFLRQAPSDLNHSLAFEADEILSDQCKVHMIREAELFHEAIHQSYVQIDVNVHFRDWAQKGGE